MSASRVATAATMNVEGIKFGVKQANDSLKKLVSVSKESDKSLKTLAFFKKWEVGLKVLTQSFRALTRGFGVMLKGLSKPLQNIPFVNSFSEFVNSTVKGTLEQYNLGFAIGANVNEMQALALAAQDVGLEVNQLYEPISKLPRKIQEAAMGFGDSAKVFGQLPGIDINALRDLGATEGPIAQLKVVADALKQVTDQNQKLYLLTKIFEETGPKFQQLFALGGQGIEKFERLVKELGLELSLLDISKFKELNTLMKQLGASWQALSRDALLKVSPDLIAFLNAIKEILSDKGMREKIVDTIADLFTSVGTMFLNFTNAFLTFTGQVATLIDNLSYAVVDVPRELGKMWSGDFTPAGESADGKSALERFLELNRIQIEKLNAYWEAVLERQAALKEAAKPGKADFQPPLADKFMDKITFKALSNAASATPGKLSAAEATTQAGVELMLKSKDDGYKETREVTLLKKIEKVLQKIEKKPEPPAANLQGAA